MASHYLIDKLEFIGASVAGSAHTTLISTNKDIRVTS